jgi:hypothetical protein
MNARVQATRRGLPADYDGSDPLSCNAPTQSGPPCRARALSSGRCASHGGTGFLPRERFNAEKLRQQMVRRVDRWFNDRPGYLEALTARRARKNQQGQGP